MGLSTLDYELLWAGTASGSPAHYKGTSLEKRLIPNDWEWASSSLKGTFPLMTHRGVPGKGWLWASPQGSTGKLRQQEQKGS